MPITELEMDRIAGKVWEKLLDKRGGIGPARAADWVTQGAVSAVDAAGKARALQVETTALRAAVTALAKTSGSTDLTPAVMQKIVADAVSAAVSADYDVNLTQKGT